LFLLLRLWPAYLLDLCAARLCHPWAVGWPPHSQCLVRLLGPSDTLMSTESGSMGVLVGMLFGV